MPPDERVIVDEKNGSNSFFWFAQVFYVLSRTMTHLLKPLAKPLAESGFRGAISLEEIGQGFISGNALCHHRQLHALGNVVGLAHADDRLGELGNPADQGLPLQDALAGSCQATKGMRRASSRIANASIASVFARCMHVCA